MANNRYVMFEEQAFATETFAAFAAAAAAHPVDQVSEDVGEDHGFVYTETSAKRAARNRLLGPRITGGEIAIPLYTRGTPTLIYYALGKVTTVSEAVGPPENFAHTIEPDTTIPPFRMAIGKDLNEHQFVGCAMKSLKIDYTVGEGALATFDVLVRKELSPPGTLQTPTFPDYDVKERTFLGVEVTVEIDDVAQVAVVRSLSIEIANDLVEDNHGFGSRFLPSLRVQSLTVTGSMTLAYNTLADYQDVLDETEKKFEFLFATGTKGMIDYRDIEIILDKLSFDTVKLPTDGNKEFILEVNFTAEIDPAASGELLQIICHNDEVAADFAI